MSNSFYIPTVGTDGTVGGPNGTPLSASVVTGVASTITSAATLSPSARVVFVDATGSLPPSAPSVTGSTSGGTFANGTYYWKITATGGPSGESLPTSEVTATLAGFLAAPSGLVAAAPTGTTGTFAATGTYYYKITGTNAAGETTGSTEITVTITATTQTVPLSWTALAGATGYKVYRATASGGESTSPALVTTITSGATTSYTDTGTATTTGAVPATNTAATTTGSAALSWTAAPGATGYKIYRSTVSGGENISPALVASVGAVTSYTDTGTATTAGSVPSTNGGAFTLTLPSAAGFDSLLFIKAITNDTANLVTLATSDSQVIDGVASTTLGAVGSTAAYVSVTLASDSANWRTL